MASVGWLLHTLFLVSCAVLANSSNSSSVKHKLYIGAFFDLESANGLGTHPAATMAIEEINNNEQYLKDYELVLVKKSTKGLLSHVTRHLYQFLHNGTTKLMLLGPFSNDLAKTVAAYAGLKDIGVLQFSYGATDVQLSSNRNLYPLFFRTVPTDHVFNEPRLEFIRHFKWKKEIGLLYHHSPHYTEINYLLYKSLTLNGIQIVSNEGFTEDPSLPLKTLEENGAHIIIGTFHHSEVKKVLCEAYHNGMYGENYVWLLIATPTMTSDWWVPGPGDDLSCTREQLETALDHHFIFHYKNEINGSLISGKTTSDFDAAYNRRVPVSRFRSEHAPYAYEAVWAIAQVLERSRPTLEEWGQPLHSLVYGDKDVTNLLLRETKKAFFIGPSGEVGFETNGNRRCEVFIGQFRQQGGTSEVGRYSFHPATLTLGGSSNGNSQVDDKLHGITWPANQPYEQTVIGTKWAHINLFMFIVICILAGLALMICFFCLLGLVALRNHRVIENSGFILTVLVIIGCSCCLMAVVLLGLDGALISLDLLLKVCKIRTWLLSLGFTLCLSSFLSRVWYAYSVLEKRPETIEKVPWLVLLAGVVLLLVVDVIFLAIWLSVFPPRIFEFVREVEHPRPFYKETVMIDQCVSEDNATALAILLLPKLLLLIIGTVAGWTTRMVYVPLCNNTRACALCLAIMFLTCCVEVPVTLRLREYPNAFFGITGVVIVVLALVLLVVAVLPQLKRAWQCRKRMQMKQEDNLEQHSLASPSTLEHTCAPTITDWHYMISGLTNKKETVTEPRVVVEKELVYVEPEKVSTSVNETQTEVVTLLSKYVLTDPVEEPEPEKPEVADVTMQTDEEPVTPVSEVDTQTVGPETTDSRTQTVGIETNNTEVQADETEAPFMYLFPDGDVSDAGSSVSNVSTASQPGKKKKKRKSRFSHIKSKVDTNLSEERKMTLPTKVVIPRGIRIRQTSDQSPPEDV